MPPGPHIVLVQSERGGAIGVTVLPARAASDTTCPACLQAEDMRAAKQYLESLGKQVVGLVGHSKAGSGVVLYAAKHDDIPRVVNISGRFDNQRGAPALHAAASAAWHALCKAGGVPG